MAHVPAADEARIYYLDQLCTIALCGALAGVGILMWHQDLLKYILAEQFHALVLAGGGALLLLVGIRAVVLWRSVGQPPHTHDHHEHSHTHHHPGHNHDHHDHAQGCTHDHHHHPPQEAGSEDAGQPPCPAPDPAPAHDHDHHDHAHGWSPWRYMVLLVPFALYLCGLPNQGFSAARWQDYVNQMQLENTDALILGERSKDVLPLEFTELRQAAFLPARRAFYEGKTGRLLGQFLPGATPTTGSLLRVKMVCCAADVTPLSVIIVSPQPVPAIKLLDWVEVTGQIQFRKRRDRDEFIPVLQIQGAEDIQVVSPPTNPYL